MQSGRGGMGSHKHGISGWAPHSPRLRHWMRRLAESYERRWRGGIKDPAASVRELLKREKSRKR